MNKINTSFVNGNVPQSQKVDEAQILNPAGGYVWKVDDIDRLRRFLMLGVEGGTYYAGERQLTQENAQVVASLAITNGSGLVREIVDVSTSGRAAKQDPTLFALAMAAVVGTNDTKRLALDAIPTVCRTASHLFSFVDYYVGLGGGWGRAMRNAVSKWYNDKSAGDLVYQVTKYQQRGGWSHRDLLRLGHPRPVTSDHNKIYRYATKGDLHFIEDDVMDVAAFKRLEAIVKAKNVRDEKEMIRMIHDFNLVREHIPTEMLSTPAVQEALLAKMPLTAMIRNLGGMTASGLIAPMSNAAKMVEQKLANEEALRKARVHPFNVLVAMKTYQMGHGVRGRLSWSPVQQIVDQLDSAFYASFQNVEPTGKNFLLGVDVSGSMGWGIINGAPGLTPMEAAAAMSLITANTEPNHLIMGFSHQLVELKISPKMRLDTVVDVIRRVPMGGTDCALPMLHATKNKIPVDVFGVYTDNETWAGQIHPSKALVQYRKAMHRPARMFTCAFTGGRSTIADPNDSGMMDLSGFDSAAPGILREFALGNV